MSLSQNFPILDPSLLLDFANSERLDPRITFTRTTTARYYDGVTTAKAEENLLLRSQEFENAFWTTAALNISVSANTGDTTAPDGTSTADKLTDDATNSSHRLLAPSGASISIPGSTTFALSVFLKKGTLNFAYIGFRDGSTADRYIAASFDLNAGTVGSSYNPGGGTLVGATITSVGNGWYRCAVVGALSGTANSNPNIVIGMCDSASPVLNQFLSYTYIGSGSTIYAWGAQLEQRSAVTAYTATTTQPITNYIPVLLTAAAGQARLDHNPTTGASLGLLVEEQRSNLQTYSDDFANAAWTKTRSSITSNTIIAPDGTLTGDKLIENNDNNTHLVQGASITPTASTAYTFTCYTKAAERTQIAIGLTGAGNLDSAVVFNLATGAYATTIGAAPNSYSITAVGNGWYRCSITWTTTNTNTMATRIYMASSNVISYTGDGTSGIYVWGAQLEAGAFPTSYIQTVASTMTRNADAANMTGVNFSSWYNAGEGTLFAETIPYALVAGTSGTFPAIISVTDGTANNLTGVLNNTSASSRRYFTVSVGGVAQATLDAADPSYVVGVASKFAGAYKLNDFGFSRSGEVAQTDTSGTVPIVNALYIGNRNNGNYSPNIIRKLAYYPQRLTNAQLQALTS